jgi:hypothetical protein
MERALRMDSIPTCRRAMYRTSILNFYTFTKYTSWREGHVIKVMREFKIEVKASILREYGKSIFNII